MLDLDLKEYVDGNLKDLEPAMKYGQCRKLNCTLK